MEFKRALKFSVYYMCEICVTGRGERVSAIIPVNLSFQLVIVVTSVFNEDEDVHMI